MIQNQDFIITGLQPWDIAIGSNAKNIATEIARNNRVLYVNTPLDHITLIRKEDTPEFIHRKQVIEKKIAPLRQVEKNLWVLDFPFAVYSVNKIPWPKVFDFFNRENNRKMCRYLASVIRQLDFKNIIHINDNDIFRSFYFKEIMKPSVSVYYRRDNLLGVDYWKRHGSRLEPLLAAKSDLVLANSIQLAEAVKKYNVHSYDVGQGVDLSNFDLQKEYPKPADMKDLPFPVIGYAGFLTTLRLDANMLYEIARQRPHYAFVLVGPQDNGFATHPLHQLPNVYFLGNKPNQEVATYISNFDICINPQVVNDTTIGNYPRKIDEYLALGKPAIATDTPTMQLFKDFVYLCKNESEYLQAIDKAIKYLPDKDAARKRSAFAKEHTWKNSVDKMYQYIEQL